eukprot:4603605-Amphidinium_carterae.1
MEDSSSDEEQEVATHRRAASTGATVRITQFWQLTQECLVSSPFYKIVNAVLRLGLACLMCCMETRSCMFHTH